MSFSGHLHPFPRRPVHKRSSISSCYDLDWPETRVPLLLLGQEKLRSRLSCREGKRAEDGLRVTNPLQVLPEDLHHFRGHFLVERHLNQLRGITADDQSHSGPQMFLLDDKTVPLVRFIISNFVYCQKYFSAAAGTPQSVNNQWEIFWRHTTGLARK